MAIDRSCAMWEKTDSTIGITNASVGSSVWGYAAGSADLIIGNEVAPVGTPSLNS